MTLEEWVERHRLQGHHPHPVPTHELPGEPISREQLVAEWEDLHHRNLMKGPVASFLFDVHYWCAPTGESAASPQLIAMVASRCPKLSELTCGFVGSRRSLI